MVFLRSFIIGAAAIAAVSYATVVAATMFGIY